MKNFLDFENFPNHLDFENFPVHLDFEIFFKLFWGSVDLNWTLKIFNKFSNFVYTLMEFYFIIQSKYLTELVTICFWSAYDFIILQYNTIILSLHDLDLYMTSTLQCQEAFRNNNSYYRFASSIKIKPVSYWCLQSFKLKMWAWKTMWQLYRQLYNQNNWKWMWLIMIRAQWLLIEIECMFNLVEVSKTT